MKYSTPQRYINLQMKDDDDDNNDNKIKHITPATVKISYGWWLRHLHCAAQEVVLHSWKFLWLCDDIQPEVIDIFCANSSHSSVFKFHFRCWKAASPAALAFPAIDRCSVVFTFLNNNLAETRWPANAEACGWQHTVTSYFMCLNHSDGSHKQHVCLKWTHQCEARGGSAENPLASAGTWTCQAAGPISCLCVAFVKSGKDTSLFSSDRRVPMSQDVAGGSQWVVHETSLVSVLTQNLLAAETHGAFTTPLLGPNFPTYLFDLNQIYRFEISFSYNRQFKPSDVAFSGNDIPCAAGVLRHHEKWKVSHFCVIFVCHLHILIPCESTLPGDDRKLATLIGSHCEISKHGLLLSGSLLCLDLAPCLCYFMPTSWKLKFTYFQVGCSTGSCTNSCHI